MAVTPANLTAPDGPIELTMFPGENVPAEGDPTRTKLEVRLQMYIDKSVAKVGAVENPDGAVRLWALHLAFHAAYMVAVSRPSTENTGVPVLGSSGHAVDQRNALREEAERYRREFDELIQTLPTTLSRLPYGQSSYTGRINFDW